MCLSRTGRDAVFLMSMQSNYAIGLTPEKARIVYLIDFGLARRYRLPSGELRPVPHAHPHLTFFLKYMFLFVFVRCFLGS